MNVLNFALRLNAASCLLFGGLFVMMPGAVADFVGAPPTRLVTIVGALLLLNGVHLLTSTLRQRVPALEIYYFSTGDLLWVTLTLGLVASGSLITTPGGVAASLAVATFVGAIGVVQLWAMRRGVADGQEDDHLPKHFSTWGAIAASWLSMKPWVKNWLFGVNAIFIASAAFWPEPIARLTLAGYVASGPWLIAIMISQRGLTRLLGVAHLVPWTPLVVYLTLRTSSDLAGPRLLFTSAPGQFSFVLAFLMIVGSCLAFDVVDLWRWLRGERFRLGSVAAARAGASLLGR